MGIPFVGHVPLTVLPSEASKSGMKSQEHLLEIIKECAVKPNPKFIGELKAIKDGIERSNMFNNYILETFENSKADSLYQIFVENHTWITPTLSMWYKNAWYEDELPKDDSLMVYLPQYIKDYWKPSLNDHLTNRDNKEFIDVKKKLYSKYLEIVGVMNDKGILLLAGTDMGANPLCFPGIGVHNELREFVKAGLTPFEALQTATINPAKFFGIEKDYGTVETGKIADLVILDKNPLENISNTLTIKAVIRDGILMDYKKINRIKKNISINQKP